MTRRRFAARVSVSDSDMRKADWSLQERWFANFATMPEARIGDLGGVVGLPSKQETISTNSAICVISVISANTANTANKHAPSSRRARRHAPFPCLAHLRGARAYGVLGAFDRAPGNAGGVGA